jgi:hypothetical protein
MGHVRIAGQPFNVRFGSLTDMGACPVNVRFTPESSASFDHLE